MEQPPLGPFQDFWQVWDESHDVMVKKDLEHFRYAFDLQFKELGNHLSADNTRAAANEAADIISIGLNLMRRLGYTPEEVAVIARDRAEKRMKGQTREILEKYP
jgi:hypothetical protein